MAIDATNAESPRPESIAAWPAHPDLRRRTDWTGPVPDEEDNFSWDNMENLKNCLVNPAVISLITGRWIHQTLRVTESPVVLLCHKLWLCYFC